MCPVALRSCFSVVSDAAGEGGLGQWCSRNGFYSDLHFAGRNVRGHVISQLQICIEANA